MNNKIAWIKLEDVKLDLSVKFKTQAHYFCGCYLFLINLFVI